LKREVDNARQLQSQQVARFVIDVARQFPERSLDVEFNLRRVPMLSRGHLLYAPAGLSDPKKHRPDFTPHSIVEEALKHSYFLYRDQAARRCGRQLLIEEAHCLEAL
jgi:hypothetical protein